ncbi:DUF397 domain-containing protein [Nocardia cyriacigeorgica]|uniref:Putative regulator n=1 Tax=Nocardia cyriacigeorgica (strain GUH-2) TaxID=1127134 RepID=H6R496_NOCCG|nr:DUF397 domain-containing protein [Nocardia cyriacigeorgica]MBF6285142.1 DUF397 domain-containing protein [Nocardia cyriacigeorgica]CCF65810.1 putative regulator [Nocardia cyriacigeorgica GUH-2]
MNIDDSGSARTGWFKSSYSGDSQTCVEVSFTPDSTLVRDSKHPDRSTQPILVFTPSAWTSFVAYLESTRH